MGEYFPYYWRYWARILGRYFHRFVCNPAEAGSAVVSPAGCWQSIIVGWPRTWRGGRLQPPAAIGFPLYP